MGQLLDWPEVITEGAALEERRKMLSDTAMEMAAGYGEEGRQIPTGAPVALFERIPSISVNRRDLIKHL